METHTHYNRIAGGDVGRIEALSDGIFAFAATVLVLDFHTPDATDIHTEAQLLGALAASAPRLMPWLLSLMTLGIFWVGQQTQLNQLERSNRDLTWLHFVFLADRHRVAVLDPAACRLLHLPHRVRHLLGQHLPAWRRPLRHLGLCGTGEAHSRGRPRRDVEAIRTAHRRSPSRSMRRRVVGLFNVPLGIVLIILIQLNYAIAPRLPVLSRL